MTADGTPPDSAGSPDHARLMVARPPELTHPNRAALFVSGLMPLSKGYHGTA